MDLGQIDWKMTDDGILALAWKDSKMVRFISTCSNATGGDLLERKSKGKHISRYVPPVAQLYLKGMRYVDTNDQLISFFRINRISKKWWHPIFYNLLDCSIVNSWIALKKAKNLVDCPQKDFRLELAAKLVGNFSSRRKIAVLESPRSLHIRFQNAATSHVISKPGSRKYRQCSDKCSVRTIWYCATCDKYLHKDHAKEIQCL